MKAFLVLVIAVVSILGCVAKREFVDPNAYAEGRPMRHGFWFGTESPKVEPAKFTPDAKSAERGARVYAANCIKCHGPQGRGDGPQASQLKNRPANLKSLAGMFPRSSFFMQISGGKNEMPAWQDALSASDIQDLTQYLHTLVPSK